MRDSFKSRVRKREAMRSAGATLCPTSAPFWSAPHSCMMEDGGGFVLPVVMAPDAWAQAAGEQQAKITGQR